MKRRCASARSSRAEPRVVGDRLHAELRAEPARQPVALRARARVDDPGQRAGLAQRRGDPAVDRLLRRARDDRERQVRPVEPGRDAHGIAQPEPLHDVRRDLRRRRRGRRRDRLRAEPARRVGEPEVVRPEVVPPLGDAVRLVDHEQPDVRVADPLQEARRGEPLRRDVEQPHVARGRALDRPPVGRGVLLGVDERHPAGRHALDRLDLVLHQRHERRHHEREVRAHQRRQLVAERLARARGHHHQHVARREARLDRLALARPEGLEAEQLAQRRARLRGARDGLRRRRAQPREGDVVHEG